MTYLVTGCAGFIGSNLTQKLLGRGHDVIGIDNLNAYYDVQIKLDRLELFKQEKNFTFLQVDFSNYDELKEALAGYKINKAIHLGAQAGVRYSLINPHAYVEANLLGHLNILEICRNSDCFEHLVYASSSSVYGANKKTPFSINDRVDTPISLYAATKRADELISYAYSHLYNIPATGLRFFTVYGPWGRPDMAIWIFTNKIINGEAIDIFNNGEMMRDFTYVDDIAHGIMLALETPARGPQPHRIFNLGNNNPVALGYMIELIEKNLGVDAKKNFLPMQPGDVENTYADISESIEQLGYMPNTSIEDGIKNFVEWYKKYHKIH